MSHSSETLDEDLLVANYADLRQLAGRLLRRERPDHTLQPTALVHEVYCRLRRQQSATRWEGRDHVLAVASEAMRRILVDSARRRLAAKRGGGRVRQYLDPLPVTLPMDANLLLDIHEALDRLAEEHPVAADLVKLRVFGGFSHIESAGHLDLSKGQADRLWAFAKARLYVLMLG